MNLSVWFRLTLCLVMLHGWVHASCKEVGDGFGGTDSSEISPPTAVTGLSPGADVAGIVAKGEDGNVGGDGEDVVMTAERNGGATVPVAGRAHDAIGETGEESAAVGECNGRRFKKCR